jgi:hypothetical protein
LAAIARGSVARAKDNVKAQGQGGTLKRLAVAVVGFLGLLWVIVAIRTGVHRAERHVESATLAPSASVMPAPEPTPQATPHQTYSVATFTRTGDLLDECAEITFWTDSPVDPKKVQTLLKGTGVPSHQGCDQAFPDRPVFASCARSTTFGDAGVWMDIVEKYYDASRLERNDTPRKNCFEVGGQWKAIAHDDPSYTRARLRGRAKDLERDAEQMQPVAP